MRIARTLSSLILLGAAWPAAAVPCGPEDAVYALASDAPPALAWSGAEPDDPLRLTLPAAATLAEFQATSVLLSEPRSSLLLVGAGTVTAIALRRPRRQRARI